MSSNINLSERLKKVASLLPKEAFFADIGSDHAYLPCYVCLQDHSSQAIAGEVNVGPYESAVKTVKQFNMNDRIEVRLGNGLAVLEKEEVDQLVIAGMGGSLIRSILEDGRDKLDSVKQIIAQPNIDARSVRKWFLDNDYIIENEGILEENGHIYEILSAKRDDTSSPYQDELLERQLLFGPYLMKDRNVVFYKKWRHEYEKLQRVLLQMERAKVKDEVKIKQFTQELKWMEEIINDKNKDHE
ncbi:tRNA (adenine(22)-N(1))-methyltransferase [Oceanobacillus jordanicus]|uniref:tRNA (Adenine(22)-N(1))-methyltransferase TrmK n=1 Tax=Oceanobacillus jordanicus TaxID=2867266 RepID=A0AAW5B5Y7_9BACI|nr:tRNA (adenine(22)-N(1))-methyltransferase TrmK [Oceanobacillus jordanicus]MCG3418682.1 tRNA (adenine(22)-N(1))-methyltransferase TrmK [Oceanobacillus jordanicus]NAP01474.1 tRNA (adenine(22)-N(1))-methyltransferase TrmK [Halomonas sp. MG34]